MLRVGRSCVAPAKRMSGSVASNEKSISRKKLEGDLKSCKSELGKLRQQLQKMERSQGKLVRDLHDKIDNLSLRSPTPNTQQQHTPSISPIGYLESCFPEKNGTPRQGSITPSSKAKLRILWGTNPQHTLEGLECFSHVWVIFHFHANKGVVVKAKVRPPQLSGEKKGLFSTRTPHRPNPVGLSLCKVEKIEHDTIYLSGVDIIDGTPIIDIKPYIPAFDNPELHPLVHLHPLPESKEDVGNVEAAYFTQPKFVKNTQAKLSVKYSEESMDNLRKLLENGEHQCKFLNTTEDITNAIEEIICNEPRSIYRRTECEGKPYGFIVDALRITCMIQDGTATITSIKPAIL